MRAYFDAEEAGWRLTDSHRGILQEVQRMARIGTAEMASRLEISPSVCRRLVEELIYAGYLMESAGKDELVLTDDGRCVFAANRTRTFLHQY